MSPRNIAVSLVLFSSVIALNLRGAESTADSTTSQQQITALEQQWLDGLKKPDFAALEAVLADDFTLTGPDGKLVAKDAFLQALKDGNLKVDSIENNDVKIRVYGDAAVAVGRTTMKGNIGGNDIGGDYAFTDTFIRKAGKWQQVAGQISRIAQ